MFLFVLACAAREPTLSTAPPMVQPPPPRIDLGTQWVHGSDAHQAVLATIYQDAGEELAERAQALEPDTAWAIVSDVDETLVDNSAYQIQTLGQFSPDTWAVWEEQGMAVAYPGAVALVAGVHELGGRMAFVTNRSNHPATLALLQAQGLWAQGDVLCVRTESSNKTARRQSVLEGGSLCGWPGEPVQVLGYWGDQMGDFPSVTQDDPSTQKSWGETWFMLPNPMYGSWAD